MPTKSKHETAEGMLKRNVPSLPLFSPAAAFKCRNRPMIRLRQK
nr:MAG TPA: hypothetical protein [Crassvirales sp.]